MKRASFHGLLISAALVAGSAMAADHRDGPLVATDPAADINDVFAWTSNDGERVNLAMTVWPAATENSMFSDAIEYRFNTQSRAAYGADASDQRITCTFEANQSINCSVGGVTVSGDASSTTGIMSPSGELRVFAGLRNDPFFFNLAGFRATAETVAGAASGLTFDGNGCPALDEATSNALVTQLATAPGGGQAEDFFAGLNTLAIVLSVDKTLLTSNGPILSVWGSTQQRIR